MKLTIVIAKNTPQPISTMISTVRSVCTNAIAAAGSMLWILSVAKMPAFLRTAKQNNHVSPRTNVIAKRQLMINIFPPIFVRVTKK